MRTRDAKETTMSIKALIPLVMIGMLVAPAAAYAQEEVIYFHTDAIGSVRATTNASGAVQGRYDYLPFGELWPSVPPPPVEVRQFAGKEREKVGDHELDYFGARYHFPVTGRFTTVDPVLNIEQALIDPQQWNRYAYARDNPFRYVDPDGRAIESIWDAFNIGLGFTSLVGNLRQGSYGAAIVDAIGVAIDTGAAAVPILPGGASSAIKGWRIAENAQAGRAFESAVLGALGASKNTGAVSEIATKVTTIPDLPIGSVFGVTDIKNVQNLSFSKQLQAQFAAAQTAGTPFNLILSTRTMHVSGPLRRAIEATGGRIFVYDEQMGKFFGAVFDERGNILR